MNETFGISIERPGVADLPELVSAADPEAAGAVVAALLRCHDSTIARVVVRINRITTKQVAVLP